MTAVKQKKPRTFFKSNEIAHQWAHQLVPFARSPGNMSFEGTRFKSYATTIANIITHKGRKAFVLDRARFSVSTCDHQSAARRAIPDSEKVFHVHIGRRSQYLDFTPATLRDHYVAEYNRPRENSRYQHKRDQEMLHRASRLRTAIDVCGYFGLGAKKLQKLYDTSKPYFEAGQTRLFIREAKRGANREQARIRNAEALRLDSIAQAEKFLADPDNAQSPDCLDYLDADLRARVEAAIRDLKQTEIDAWLAGEPNRLPYDCPTMLRAKRCPSFDLMETSEGVTVPLADAERAFKFITAIRNGRGDWHRNGETFAIGQFQLDAVNPQGVVAGCHRVSWEEIDRFSTVMGWATSNVPAAVVT